MEDELIHELAAPYALDALAPDEERRYEAHLAHCPRCQEELAAFSETAASLAFAVPSAGAPPPALRERILAAARAEREPVVVPLRRRWSYVPVAAAAVAACIAIGLGIWGVDLHSRLDKATSVQALPLRGASGSVVLTGNHQATLVVAGLPRAPAGKTYEAWVLRGAAAQPAGVFSGTATTTVVHLDRRVPSGARVAVTLEPAGGSLRPTSAPFITSASA